MSVGYIVCGMLCVKYLTGWFCEVDIVVNKKQFGYEKDIWIN